MEGIIEHDTGYVHVRIGGVGVPTLVRHVPRGRQLGSLLPAGRASADFGAGRLVAVDPGGRAHSYTEEISSDLDLTLELSYEGMLQGDGAFLLCIMPETAFRQLNPLIGASGCEAYPCHSLEHLRYFEKRLLQRLERRRVRALVMFEWADRLGIDEDGLRSLNVDRIGRVHLRRPEPQSDFRKILPTSSLAFERDFGLCLQDHPRIQRGSLVYGMDPAPGLEAFLVSVDCANLVDPGWRLSRRGWEYQGRETVSRLHDLFDASREMCTHAVKVFYWAIETAAEDQDQSPLLSRERLVAAHLSPRPLAVALGVL